VRIRSHRDECIPRGRAVRIVAALLSRSVFVFYTSLVLARKKERKKRERGKEREREREREPLSKRICRIDRKLLLTQIDWFTPCFSFFLYSFFLFSESLFSSVWSRIVVNQCEINVSIFRLDPIRCNLIYVDTFADAFKFVRDIFDNRARITINLFGEKFPRDAPLR